MKLMVCANLLVGDAGVLNMPPELLMKWHDDKIEALAAALEDARERGAEACIMAGGLLAEGFVPQSLFVETVEEITCHGMPVTWLPLEREASDLALRMKVPEGLAVSRDDAASPIGGVKVAHQGSDIDVFFSMPEGPLLHRMGLLEPMGFGEQAEAGYLLVDVTDGQVASVEEISRALHPFVIKSVDLSGLSGSKKMLEAVQSAIKGLDGATCLHMILKGAIPLSAYFNTDGLSDVLGRKFFYAEVSNECTVDLDEGELSSDVSLLAEFVRMVDGDDSLSPTEKTRIMRCGWNALNGKELAE